MVNTNVGISDIAIYIPRLSIAVQSIIEQRSQEHPEMRRRLRRAMETAGQSHIRFPNQWEDTVTMSAQAAQKLFEQRSMSDNLAHLRYLAVGTETTVDHSKPVAAYVQGVLQQAGHPIPENMSTFQIQHACASGTIAMMNVAAMLQASNRQQENGLVICSDIARYDAASTAEITQGAGAVALLIEHHPRLLTLDLATQGFSSQDVDDFFRPLGSQTARVKGSYSIKCYHLALERAFRDYCHNYGASPQEVLQQTDLFVLHVPFYRMGMWALHNLIAKFCDMSSSEINQFLSERGFPQSLAATTQVGNIYSGSVFLTLASLLSERSAHWKESLVGRRVLICSYGSGNTMAIMGATVAPEALDVVASWNKPTLLDDAVPQSFERYSRWVDGTYDQNRSEQTTDSIPPGSFYLSAIRKDGYREYERR